MRNYSCNKGQTLLEVMAAVAVIMIAAVILAAAMTNSLANNRLATERVVATRLSQEGVEWLRVEREAAKSWDNFMQGLENADDTPKDNIVYFCINQDFFCFKDQVSFNSPGIDNNGQCITPITIGNTEYIREIRVAYNYSVATVSSSINWYSRGRQQTVSTKSELYQL